MPNPNTNNWKVARETYPTKKALDDVTIDVLGFEEVANFSPVQAEAKMYFELNCKEKRIAVLSVALYQKNGDLAHSKDDGAEKKFKYIV